MSETEIMKSNISNILEGLLQRKGIDVQKIVIFGSYARSTQRKDSDIDVIIVSKDFRDKSIFERVELVTGIGRELVRKVKKPFDLLFYSDDEWNGNRSLIINEAKENGETIYG